MRENRGEEERVLFLARLGGILPVSWAALLLTPYLPGGLTSVLENYREAFAHPLRITFTKDSFRTVLIFLLFYELLLAVWWSTKRNYRIGEEHGSARWGNARQVNRKYMQFPPEMNKILTRHVHIGLDGKKHRRNLNVIIVGGSGAGKTRFYAKDNVMQANSSMVILDPKGETNYSHFFITFFQRREMQ